MSIRSLGVELFHVDGRMKRQTDRQTDISKLIVSFSNLANAPKNCGTIALP